MDFNNFVKILLPTKQVILYKDDFFCSSLIKNMYDELMLINEDTCKKFDRNDSLMFEYNQIENCKYAQEFVNLCHSKKFLTEMSNLVRIPYLICDPYLIGAGYSKTPLNKELKTHVDFNWNDELRLERAYSLIVYLTEDWKPVYGGNLNFYNINDELLYSVTPKFNRCVFFSHSENTLHGYNKVKIKNRTTFRLFFYKNNLDENIIPHRSLYYKDKKGIPVDIL